jgi:hypothetical protein
VASGAKVDGDGATPGRITNVLRNSHIDCEQRNDYR